jgi:putative membrane protein
VPNPYLSALLDAKALAAIDVMNDFVRPVTSVVVVSVVAIALLVLSLKVMERVLPFSPRKELEEDHNVAAAIVMGAIILGISIVIAAVAKG